MEQQHVVTAVVATAQAPKVEVSTPVQQAVQHREEPKAQAFVAEAPAPAVDPVASQPAPVAAQPVPAPAAIESQPAPAVTVRAEVAKADPKEVLSGAGLVMIETDPSRSKSYVLEEAPVQLGRPRRERSQQAPEELKQVETKN